MRKSVLVLLLWVLPLIAKSSALADVYRAKPKLVVILVIDQFRGDDLDRYRDALKRLMDLISF
jgi:predicted AlkP superfamily pyrophosphatase or phosphodiesterase